MTTRVTVYLDNDIAKKLDKFENKSRIIKEALNMYLFSEETFISKEKVAENEIKETEFKLKNQKYVLDLIRKQLKKIRELKDNRPDDYLKSVNILKSLPDVSNEDLKFQAELLNVDAMQLKEWLWYDVHYDEIFYR